MRRGCLAGAVMVGLSLAACGSSGTDQMVRSGTVPVERTAEGRLASNPAPLTVEDVEKQPDGSAQRAVMQLIFWVQWGNLPAIADTYDSRIVARLGVSRIVDPYNHLRFELLTSQPRVIAERRSGAGEFVSIELASTRGAPAREGFLMLRRNGRWRVVYDTLLERAIEALTISQEEPDDPTPSIATRRIAARAAQQYRDVSTSLALARRLRAAR